METKGIYTKAAEDARAAADNWLLVKNAAEYAAHDAKGGSDTTAWEATVDAAVAQHKACISAAEAFDALAKRAGVTF